MTLARLLLYVESRVPESLVDAASSFAGHQVSRRAALAWVLFVIFAVIAAVVLGVLGILSSLFQPVMVKNREYRWPAVVANLCRRSPYQAWELPSAIRAGSIIVRTVSPG